MIKTTINNNTTHNNNRICHCSICHNLISTNGKQIYTKNNNGYVCSSCASSHQGAKMVKRQRRINSGIHEGKIIDIWEVAEVVTFSEGGGYGTENDQRIHNETKTNQCTISMEHEVPYSALDYNNEANFKWLTLQGFYSTSDCTVWREFKSPIYNNLLGLSKVLHNFEKLNQLEKWNNDTSYGTHLNIGNSALTRENLKIIERFYHSLFVPYSKYLEENKEKTITLHGRFFTNETSNGFIYNSWNYVYAQSINENTDTQTHENFINMQHSTHIEFRLCKLVTARQYMMVTRMYQDIIQKVLVDYFLKRYNESMTASQKRQLAKKASEKMIKIFNKYYNKLTNQ
ncbi:MAG: hypothetical protein IJW82_06215 [Clostridia bacterium]|nr:hypothetical protein [Clostridia bacterium]